MKEQRGFTLIEVIVALAILAVGILGTVAAVNTCMTARAFNHEYIIVVNAARAQYEKICNEGQQSIASFENLLNKYRYGTVDNTFDVQVPDKGTDQISGTADDKLKRLNMPQDGQNRQSPGPDGNILTLADNVPMLGWFDFPVANLGDSTVSETIAPNPAGIVYDTEIEAIARDLGMPQDINMDGDDDDTGISGAKLAGPDAIMDTADDILPYRFLPIRITIRWQGPSGVREYKFCSAVYRPAE